MVTVSMEVWGYRFFLEKKKIMSTIFYLIMFSMMQMIVYGCAGTQPRSTSSGEKDQLILNRPVLRIETGMHTAGMNKMDVNASKKNTGDKFT